jgi:hypothetical protein
MMRRSPTHRLRRGWVVHNKMSLKFLNILNEEKESCKYQIRDIGGDVYYKKCKGNSKWIFTDEVDFLKNSKKSNIEKWEKPKEKNPKLDN